METDCRYTWKQNAKEALVAAIKDGRKAEIAALQKQFDDKLGKLLEKWTAEWVKDPKWDEAKLTATRRDLDIVIRSYKDQVAKAKIGHAAPLLTNALNELDKALSLRLKILKHAREQNLKLLSLEAKDKEEKLKAAKLQAAKLQAAKLQAAKPQSAKR